MANYLKLAIKVLQRRKFFTFISLFGISLTLVVLMVATAVLDNLFAPRAPESRFDRTLFVFRVSQSGANARMTTEPGYRFVQEYVKPLTGAERIATFSNQQKLAIYKGASKIDVYVKRTDADYWQILNFRFLEGRPYTSQDDSSGALTAVITDRTRDRLFGAGAGSVLGKTFELDGRNFRVIGVVPRVSQTRVAAYADIWIPIGTMRRSDYKHNLMGGFNAMVLAHSRSDFPRLRAEFAARLRTFPLEKGFTRVITGLDTPFEGFARLLDNNNTDNRRATLVVETILVVAAVLFMALPALNLITLNLSRVLERASEIGVRKAFGAPRRALVWQFVVENIVLTLIGGIAGFILSIVVLNAITRWDLVPNAQFDVNARVFAYGMLLAVIFGVLSGVYPAWRMSRLDPVNALRGGAA